jgi:cation transport ATPase
VEIVYDTTLIDTRTTQGKTPLVIVEDGNIIGYVAVADSIKPQSIQAINELKQQ